MTIIFAVVFFVLAKWGFPIITGMVDKRNERIEESIAKAKEAEERLSGLAAEQEKMVEEARRKQADILKEATETKDSIIRQAQEQARQEASRIVADAKTAIAVEKENALRDIRAEVSVLSVNIAEKILRENLSDNESQLGLIDRMLDEMEDNSRTS